MRPRLSRLAISLLLAILQLAACNVPDREEPEEPAAEDMLAVVTLNANVRTGPSTDYAIAFGLTAGEEITVVGRNAAGDWLQIKHQDRPGWIFAALTDLVTETAAELPADIPPPVTATPTAEPEPTIKSESAPETVEPTPELPAQTGTSLHVTVTGSVVNLRRGPGTDYAVVGQVRAGDQLQATGRNAAGDWLQIKHQDRPGWIFAALTDLVTETAAELPVDVPPSVTATPTAEPEPTPELPAQTGTSLHVTVTGSVVNLRRGPGTDYAVVGQVRAGDQLQATGRNAAGDWLQVVHTAAIGEQVWIYGPLTDMDATATASLTVVEAAQAAATPTPAPTLVLGRGGGGGMGGGGIGGGGGGPAPLPPEAGGRANPNNKRLPLMYFQDYGVNPFVDADEDPLSTFALDGDTAAYALGRRYLHDGWLPEPESVRIEEYVNAFEGGYGPSIDGLSLHLDAAPAPFAPDGYVLLRVGVSAQAFPDEREPVSLIFIADVSGSMEGDARLESAKRLMLGLLEQSHPADRVALVTYSDWAEVVKPFVATEDSPDLEQAIRNLYPDGSTYAEAGLRMAYELAADDMRRGRDVRLVLFSDGVGNVGETGPEQILELVDEHAQRRATLTTVGVGIGGNYNDVMMERLANRGNGTYHYIEDQAAEQAFLAGPAQAVFHETARDARIQVEFNPETVRKYRLLGYENRAKADDTFRDDTEDFGEIGFRSDVTALYEVRPLDAEPEGWLVTARLRYRDLHLGEVVEVEADIDWDQVGEMDRYFQRQAAVAEWAELLGKSFYAQCGSIEAVLNLLPEPWDKAGEELKTLVWTSGPLFDPFCET